VRWQVIRAIFVGWAITIPVAAGWDGVLHRPAQRVSLVFWRYLK